MNTVNGLIYTKLILIIPQIDIASSQNQSTDHSKIEKSVGKKCTIILILVG